MPTVVTSALPYANGPIHIGHLVEYIQTDIFCRFLRLTGEDIIYVCADDTHGTPIELKARETGMKPEKLIEGVHREHAADFKLFDISFDIFYSTNSPENKKFAELIYQKAKEAGVIARKTVPGMYCEHDKRFLPDRYVKGSCPRCKTPDQYGDSCDACGATYEPAEMKDAACTLCGNKPVQKESEHLFFQLDRCADFLTGWVNKAGVLQEETANYVKTWIKDGLRDWCISRNGPYFGFPIPDETDKYFYVWLDAPIGYISSTQKYCAENNRSFDSFWKDPEGKVYHFIGKDIVYFHTLFWPAMLHLSGFNLPEKVFVHGFLTVNGEKMSKSRGTFITGRQFIEAIGKEYGAAYLRYYYASKLNGRADDLDLNLEDFRLKVNTGLIHNFCNFHNRSFTFCARQFDGSLGTLPAEHPLITLADETVRKVETHYRNTEYTRVIEKISRLSDAGNKYFQESAPWEKVKTDRAAAHTDITLCVNLVKVLGVLLKPVIPSLIEKLEKQLNTGALEWKDACMNLENIKMDRIDKLSVPLEADKTEKIVSATTETEKKTEDTRISFDEFGKVDLRVATVREAEPVAKTDKLLKLKIDVGGEERTLVAGVAEHYKPEELINTQIVIVANLKPAKIRGIESNGMLLAAKSGKKLVIVRPEKGTESGSKVA